MTPDNPTSGTGEDIASLDEAMGEWTDPDEQDQETDNQAAGDEQEAETPEDGENTEIDGQSEEESEPGPDELTGGQFAPHSAKIRTPDGRVTTVAELLNGSMMQADYTQKATAVAQQRQAIEAEQSRVKSLDSELQAQREVLMALANQMAPKKPDPSMIDTDLGGYTYQLAAWQEFQQGLQQLSAQMDAHKGRTAAEQTAAQQRQIAEYRQQLAAKDKRFTDRAWYTTFWNEAAKAGEYYGYTPAELNELKHPAHYLILRDALEYRKIRAKNQQNNSGKPNGRPVLTGSTRRPGNADAQRKQAAQARFKAEPSLRNAVDLID